MSSALVLREYFASASVASLPAWGNNGFKGSPGDLEVISANAFLDQRRKYALGAHKLAETKEPLEASAASKEVNREPAGLHFGRRLM
jgi:hypothetical protein